MTELPTYHGVCPYCASAVSCVTRDGMTYARCSHRGCGARGPYHRDLIRAVEWFTGKPHPMKAPAQDGAERCEAHPHPYNASRCLLPRGHSGWHENNGDAWEWNDDKRDDNGARLFRKEPIR